MPFLISDSATPLLMETVPVLKITHFYGHPQRDEVYAYLRCFVCKGALHFCLTGFDEAPPATVRFGLALQSADCLGRYLFLSVGKESGAALSLCEGDTGAVLGSLAAPPVQVVTGGDEQGLYWSAQGVLPAQVFSAQFSAPMRAGALWAGNVFLYDTQDTAFGAAFPVPAGCTVPTGAGFDSFTVVPY